jgi:hypothetical protein
VLCYLQGSGEVGTYARTCSFGAVAHSTSADVLRVYRRPMRDECLLTTGSIA